MNCSSHPASFLLSEANITSLIQSASRSGELPSTPAAACTASAADGSKIARWELAATPVFDGMAAANGKLYIALRNGEVVCLKKKE